MFVPSDPLNSEHPGVSFCRLTLTLTFDNSTIHSPLPIDSSSLISPFNNSRCFCLASLITLVSSFPSVPLSLFFSLHGERVRWRSPRGGGAVAGDRGEAPGGTRSGRIEALRGAGNGDWSDAWRSRCCSCCSWCSPCFSAPDWTSPCRLVLIFLLVNQAKIASFCQHCCLDNWLTWNTFSLS